jgi:hypothetical protein
MARADTPITVCLASNSDRGMTDWARHFSFSNALDSDSLMSEG